LLKSWLQKKVGLYSSQKNSVKRASLSQVCQIWHSGNVTTAIYQAMSFLRGRVDLGSRKSVLSSTRLYIESPDKFRVATGRLGKASVLQFKQNN